MLLSQLPCPRQKGLLSLHKALIFHKTLIIDSSKSQFQDMDFNTSAVTVTPTTASINTPDTDTELIPTSDPKSGFRAFAYTNGSCGGGGGLLKPHHIPRVVVPLPLPLPLPPPPVEYKECLKNHAAAIGGHALDGCGEFYPSPTSDPTDPTSLKCAACSCHRNFHRRDSPEERALFTPPKSASAIIVSASHHHLNHRLLPPPPAQHSSSPSPSRSTSPGPSTTLSPHSPPPVSHLPPSFFGTPSQMLLALSSSAYTVPPPSDRDENSKQQFYRGPTKSSFDPMSTAGNNNNKTTTTERKRSRTKFSQEQKDKMFSFADKLGWKMQRSQDKFVEDFCDQLGIGRHVFKVWMHNNKQQRSKKRMMSSAPHGLVQLNNDGGVDGGGGGASFDSNGDEDEEMHMEAMDNKNDNNVDVVMSNNPHKDEEVCRDQRFYFSNRGSSCSS